MDKFKALYSQFKGKNVFANDEIVECEGDIQHTISLSVEQLAAFIIYTHRCVYMQLKDQLLDVENKVMFDCATSGRA